MVAFYIDLVLMSSCNRLFSARFGFKFADSDDVNEYFANIATDTFCDSCATEQPIDSLPVSNGSGVCLSSSRHLLVL